MDIDILSQIPRLLKELVEIIQEPLENRRRRRSNFFDTEIAPIHESMKAIHEDYTKSFSELLELLESENDVPRTIELLRKKRLVLIAKRKDVQAYAVELKNIKKRGYIKKREVSAFVDFANSIRAYIQGASPVDMRVSWYSAFIQEFEAIARRSASPFQAKRFQTIETGRPPIELVRKAYSEAIHNDMPKAWERYSGAFYKLRLELKR